MWYFILFSPFRLYFFYYQISCSAHFKCVNFIASIRNWRKLEVNTFIPHSGIELLDLHGFCVSQCEFSRPFAQEKNKRVVKATNSLVKVLLRFQEGGVTNYLCTLPQKMGW